MKSARGWILWYALAMLTCAACQGNRDRGQAAVPRQTSETSRNQARPGCDIDTYPALIETHFVQRTMVTLAKPSYPTEALKSGIQGSVPVAILVDKTGTVVKACAADGPELLRAAAEKGALACKFKKNFGGIGPGRTPYRRDTLPYLFVLDPNKKVDEIHNIVVRPTP
jgi:Gram-negative bacterial TonB protein C-terminal